MLLTEEKIADVVYLARGDINFENANAIAKAQLKEVVEWLEMRSFEELCETAPANCYKRYRVMTIDVWQALLEEVK